ncbi:hypothetical protein BAC1_01114 [uncultured bacterium]|nr:hypothetical protein BAC1_01114 [uncultured bacterium]
MEYLNLLRQEWHQLSSAPISFLILTIAAFVAGYFVARWRYEAIVALMGERIEVQKDRLTAKDDQLSVYRERLHLIPTETNTFTRLSNNEIKKRTLDLIKKIREFLKDRGDRHMEFVFVSSNGRNNSEIGEQEKRKIWEQETQAMLRNFSKMCSDYNTLFKVDTILLRDELLSRLPSSAKREQEYRTYEYPTNLIGMTAVADDLERLAKSLPISHEEDKRSPVL